MKKSSDELEKELQEMKKEYEWLDKNYPRRYKYHGYWKVSPLSDEIRQRYSYVEGRISNLELNINQIKMREMNH